MNSRIRIILAQLSLFASLSLILFSAQAEMIEVGPGLGFSRIQWAIDAASPGDTIYVENGTYFESINVTKQLILIGINNPLVDARKNDSAILITANGTLLQGFSAINSSEIGIKVSSHNNIIVSNVASHNDYAGIGLEASHNNIVSGNAFLKNGVFGIVLQEGSSQNSIKGNMQNENGDAGIRLDESNLNQISDNVVQDNGNDGIELEGSSSNTITGNTALRNKDGICLEGNSKNNIIIANNLLDNYVDGILLKNSEFNIIFDNELSKNLLAIFFESSNSNLIANNDIHNNKDAIHFNYYCRENAVYNNNLVDNANYNAYDESGANHWNVGATGNHYGDFDNGKKGCIDSDDNGICDAGHAIPGGSSIDNFPLLSWHTP